VPGYRRVRLRFVEGLSAFIMLNEVKYLANDYNLGSA
jgi:hypothetical protein